MTYAAVLTHVQADAAAAPRLKCAADIAQRFGAALIGVGAEMIPPLAFDGGFYSLEADWATAMRQSIEDRLKIARKSFREATKDVVADAVWECGLQLPAPAVTAASRAADLIVAGGAPHKMNDAYRDCTPAELAITSGRPVLVAPPTAPPLAAKHIVLAWKDTREARRAMADAMPFFEKAEQVTVVAVCPQIDAEQVKLQVEDVACSASSLASSSSASGSSRNSVTLFNDWSRPYSISL